MNLTPHHITISKIINRLTVEKNKLWRFLPLKAIIRKHTKSIIKNTNSDKLKDKLVLFLGDFSDFSNNCTNKSERNEIIKLADQTLDHKFNYLGSDLTKVDPIDWHTDFKSGFTWPKGKFYKKYIAVDLNNDADVKVPWELNRCHHLLWLGEAYLLTKDEKYADEVLFQIEHWIEENPLMYSINWACAMDVAIRAVNWMYAVNMIVASSSLTDEFAKKMIKSLFEHGWFIYNNLEKGFPYSANHYASDITGLLFLSQFFIESSFGKKWWDFSKTEYFSEIRNQLLLSGVHFERSISYHRLMAELFFYPYLMMKRVNENIPIDIHERVRLMIEFIAYYTKPNGLSPMIGDSDNGRLLPFENNVFNDHRYLLGVYSKIHHSNFSYKFKIHCLIDSFFLLAGLNYKENNNKQLSKLLLSKTFQDAGFAILRSNDTYLFFNNSELSRYPDSPSKVYGTHTHCDLLSFEFSLGEQDIIIDPGTFVYTSSPVDRNNFRSTKKHNTIVIDNIEQYDLLSNNMFTVSGEVYLGQIVHQLFDEYEECEGSYKKILSEYSFIRHNRRIRLSSNSNQMIIYDYVKYEGTHELAMYFHLAPSVKAINEYNHIKLFLNTVYIATIYLPINEGAKIEILNDTISPSYGVIQKSETIKYTCSFTSEIKLETLVKWKDELEIM